MREIGGEGNGRGRRQHLGALDRQLSPSAGGVTPEMGEAHRSNRRWRVR